MPRVLLVEDNEESREGLSRYLRRNGYEILLAVDGRQAVDVARAAVPDLILIDLNLPVLDGWEATRQLKSGSETRGIPVIALTAHAMAGDRERALEAGCDDYDTKSIEFPRLLIKIESLLEKKALPAPQPGPAITCAGCSPPSRHSLQPAVVHGRATPSGGSSRSAH